jgi:uncharacterized membrane protein YqjE
MEERPLSTLVRDLVRSTSGLIRAELRLARIEAARNARDVSQDAVRGAIFAVVALLGVLALMSFLVIGIGNLLQGRYWLSSLIVAVLFMGGGGLAAWRSFRRIGEDAKLRHVARNLEGDRELVSQKVRDIASASNARRAP